MVTNQKANGIKEEPTDLLLTFKIIKKMVQLRIPTVETGLMEKNKEEALRYGMMELNLKEIMKMIRNMERALYSQLMVLYILENLKME